MQSQHFQACPSSENKAARWSSLNHRDGAANQQTPSISAVTWPGRVGHDSPQGTGLTDKCSTALRMGSGIIDRTPKSKPVQKGAYLRGGSPGIASVTVE